MRKELCFYCDVEMKKVATKYRGMEFEAFQCPKCKKRVFTEEQTYHVAAKFQARRLKKEYLKKAIKIGASWGLTFPKEIVDVFELKSKKLRILPNVEKNKIELAIE